MAANLKKHLRELQILSEAKPKLRKAILDNAENTLIKCLCECCHNILRGNVKLTPTQRKTLCKHCKVIRTLACKKGTTLQEKRELLVQKGGFLPTLLAPILGIVASLVPEIVRSFK